MTLAHEAYHSTEQSFVVESKGEVSRMDVACRALLLRSSSSLANEHMNLEQGIWPLQKLEDASMNLSMKFLGVYAWMV